MKTEIKEISPCERELKITVDAEQASQDYKKVLRNFKNLVAVPGFRKGKAPLSLVERNYGSYAKEEFYKKSISEYYKEALEKENVNPVNQGEASDIDWEKGKNLVVTFKFEVMPEVKIKKYKDLEIPFEPIEFKEEMIDSTIEDFRNRMANIEEIDEESKEGDIVKAKIKFLDEEENVTKEIEREFTVGDNAYCKSFNNKMIGIKPGFETKTKLFTKNQESKDDEIGENIKDREFLVEVESVKRKNIPELNDDFAKDMEYESVEEMRDKIDKELKKKIEKDNAQQKKNAILNKLVEENPVEVPKSLVKQYSEQMAKPYADAYKMEVDKIAPMYYQMAENSLKSQLILEELKKKVDIEITDKDIEKAIDENAANMNMDTEKYKKMYKKQIESDDFKTAIKEKKILKIIEDNSKFVPLPKETKENSKEEEE
ncbi:MAG: trigger factor [Candidatus Cloacimonadota bacterium]|nr:trigger factor [Candidatus Cloacimonadota bacterium]